MKRLAVVGLFVLGLFAFANAQQVTNIVNNIVATTCAANNWASSISVTGAATCTQPATTSLSDVTTSGSWTPSDSSGASLVFTGVNAKYTKIGNMVFAYATLTYPTTASGAAAALTGLPIATANQSYARQCSVSYPGGAVGGLVLLPGQGNGGIGVYNSTATANLTNANLSTVTIFFQCIYPVS